MASSTQSVNHRHPKRGFEDTAHLGLTAYKLATSYQADVEKRLPAGTLPQMKTDLVALGVAVPGAMAARKNVVTATSACRGTTEKACEVVSAMRSTVRRQRAPRDVQLAYGLGEELSAKAPIRVLAVVRGVLDRLTEHPEDVTDFSFAPEDIDALQTLAKEAAGAVEVKRDKRASAPFSTVERNVLANRVLHAVSLIAGAGALAFAAEPEVRARFESLHVTPPRKKGAKDAKAAKDAKDAKDAKAAKPAGVTESAAPATPSPATPQPAAPNAATPQPATPPVQAATPADPKPGQGPSAPAPEAAKPSATPAPASTQSAPLPA